MALPAIHGIELFSGVGMLGEGLRAGLDYLGIPYRSVCHIEREAHAASVLVARMEEGSMDAAPVWADVTTFNARQWRGKVDCVVAGFPCQDLSVAGRRAGLDGARSGLFFEVVRIADDCGAWLLVLENVAGIVSATASVMDPEEGELDERAASRVVGELADRGWNAEWVSLSAADVGASHGRARWFCIAWRNVADTSRYGFERRAECNVWPIKQGQQSPLRNDAERCNSDVGNAYCRMHKGGGTAMTRADGKSRLDMLDWQAEEFSRRGRMTQDGMKSSGNTPSSRPRLNPLFAAWLMGWPSTWVIAEPHASSASATASWRSALRLQLSSFFSDPELFEVAA